MKLNEIKKVKRVMSEEGHAWLMDCMSFRTGGGSGMTRDKWIQLWEDQSPKLKDYSVYFKGSHEAFDPPFEIGNLGYCEISDFTINDYSKLPMLDRLILSGCNLGPGAVEYLDKKVTTNSQLYDSLLSMDDALSYLSLSKVRIYETHISTRTLEIYGDGGGAGEFSLHYSRGKTDIEEYYDDVFDLQEKLVSLPGIDKCFK